MRKLQVEKSDEPAKISKNVKERLKDLGLSRRVSFMKKERILCPQNEEKTSPMICFACEHFRKRIKGLIYCDYSKN